MSEHEDEIFVPPQLEGRVFANDAVVYDDVDYVTIDFIRHDPRRIAAARVVARVTTTVSCILSLRRAVEHFE